MLKMDEKGLEKAIGDNYILLRDYMKLVFLCDNSCKIYYNNYQDIADKLGTSYIHVLKTLKTLRQKGLIEDINHEYLKIMFVAKE